MPIYKTGKTKNGKQQYRVTVNYIDASGKYRQSMKIAYGNSEAKDLENKMKIDLAETISGKSMTIQQLFDEYIKYKQHEVRETTLEKSKSVIKNNVIPTFGEIKLSKLNQSNLAKWKTEISSQDKKLSTKRNIYKEFHSMLNYAVRLDYIANNPLNKLGTFKDVYFETAEDKIQFYTADEFKKYIAIAQSKTQTMNDYGCYVFFSIAFYTGMRKGEINALKWSDIDNNNCIHVRRSIAQKVKGKKIVETPPKNKSSYRTLEMPLPLISILTEHKACQKKYKGFSEEWRVCGGDSCLSDSLLSVRNQQYADESGLHRIRIHDFRHTHATLLINEGINISEIARRLGHSDIKMTLNTYGHLYPREEERAVKILNNIK